MASRKKESEGIALLSMYNDEDMDVDDEDDEQQQLKEEEEEDDDRSERDESRIPSDGAKESTTPPLLSQTPLSYNDQTLKSPSPLTPQAQLPLSSPAPLPPFLDSFRAPPVVRKGAFGIVDYAHDETAMSPDDAEEGEILSTGNIMLGSELQVANRIFQEKTPPGTVKILTPNVQTSPPQSSEQFELSNYETSTTVNNAGNESEEAQIDVDVLAPVETQKGNVDPLAKFLPPPPETKCPEELQKKINKFLELKKKGISFNADLRNRKDYRNPDFLLHAVRYQDIDQIGTCFSKDVFDPHGYDKSDYYDEIEADMKREMERKEFERKKSPKVDFVSGGSQPGAVAPAPKISSQIPVGGLSAVAASGVHTVPTAVDAAARDGRQNKKTKWDKVDGDRRNPLISGGQEAIATVGAHAALLSAANAGAGYTAFAQQKRREAEEKRSSEKRSERRT